MLLFSLFSCNETPKQQNVSSRSGMKESMEKANRYLVNDEEKEIERYIARHGMSMETTGTGLRYCILKQGEGALLRKGDRVSLEYELRSIAGDVIYSYENEGVKTFVVGNGEVEAGLDEAMCHFHKGDIGKIIIPSHLGYGLHGDDNLIPAYAILIYTIKVIDNQ